MAYRSFPLLDSGRLAVGILLAGSLGWSSGCSGPGSEPTTPGVDGPVTFTGHIAPILFENCSSCHRPGESAPFSLLTYQDARKHDKQIAQVTQSRFMPPWLPETGEIRFVGQRGLNNQQIELFQRWYEGGSPEGDPARLPPLPTWPEGWQLGQPDLVIEADRAYTLPADGIDVFRNLILPIPVETTRYVRAVDLRPGNPRIVHHAVMRVDRSRSSRLLDQLDEEPGYPGMEWGEAQQPEGHFLGWTPGKAPYPGSNDTAWILERGSDLVVQLHMVPTGKPETIRPRVGIYFADGPPIRPVDTLVLDAKWIDIPAGESEYVLEESYELPVEVEITSVYPHAHYLGKKMQGWATLPDGTRRSLIHVPSWDFNWQDQYRYEEPISLPAGSTIHMRYSYDNSADNINNPHRPPVRVVSGNRSTDEMGSMSFEVVLRDEQDREVLREALLRQDLENWPKYWVAHGLLGTLLLERGDLEEAARHLSQALRANPDYVVGYNNLGMALAELGQHDGATANFRKALELRPRFAVAHFNLGVELAARGRLDEAIDHYRQGLEVRDFDAEIHNNLGVALALQEKFDEATAQFSRAAELDPRSADALGNLGNMLAQEGWYASAIESYRRALSLQPDSADLQANLQAVRAWKTEAEVAIAKLERSGKNADPRQLRELADLYGAVGKYDRAISTAREALDALPPTGAETMERELRARLQSFEGVAGSGNP